MGKKHTSPLSTRGKGDFLVPLLLLGLGLGLRLGLAWQDHHFLLAEWVWSDDSYLSLSVARNLAAGHGMTSDGTHVTNGFQPLYVFLLVPIYWLVGPENLTLPIHLAGTLLALAGTGAAALFYLTARRLFSRPAAWCVLFFFTLSDYFVLTDVNGLETAVYGLTLAATLYYYVTRFIQTEAVGWRSCLALGLLGGLTFLARVDGGIFLLCIALHFAWQRRRAWGRLFRQAGAGLAGFALVVGPWLVTSVVLCGALFPVSGPAVRFLSIQNGWRPVSNLVGHQGSETFVSDQVPWAYYANNVLHEAVQLVAFWPLTAHTQGFVDNASLAHHVERYPLGRWVSRAPWVTLAAVLGLTLLGLVGPWWWRDRRSSPKNGLRAIAFLRFAAVGWVAAYALYLLCPWYSHRYLYPVIALLTLGSGALLEVFFERVLGNRRRMRHLVLGAGAVLYSFLFYTHLHHFYVHDLSSLEPDRYTPVVPWAAEHLPPDAVIGSFQTGVLSYFLPQRCVNLDGVVNGEALAAMRAHRLWDYIRAQRIDYLIDWSVCIEELLPKFAGVEHVPLQQIGAPASMKVYRVLDRPGETDPGEARLDAAAPAW